MFGNAAVAPSVPPQASEAFAAIEGQQWLTDAKTLNQVGETVASGIYFYHLSAGHSGLSVPHRSDYSETRKMLILK